MKKYCFFTFSYEGATFCYWKLLSVAVKDSKIPWQVPTVRFGHNTGKNELPWSVGVFPAFTARQRNGPRQVQQPGGVV